MLPARRRRLRSGLAVLTASLAAFLGVQAPAHASAPPPAHAPAPPPVGSAAPEAAPGTDAVPAANDRAQLEPSCGSPRKGRFTCFALRRTDTAARKAQSALSAPTGYGPADLRGAYGLPANGGAGQTIAVVDAFDDPTAEADLAVYREQYGLPACTATDGCFRKVDQRGGTEYPEPSADWSDEISLDLDMVSAVAPEAHILLVEADSDLAEDFGAAVDQAVALGAKFVSNSYGSYYDSLPGGGEDPAETADAHYNHPGVAMVAAAGDLNYGVPYPAASPYVTSVGGTSLLRDTSTPRGWSESVWSSGGRGTGSGCSAYQPKPAFQKDTGCEHRTTSDVSAVADPGTGVAVYQTYGHSGWQVYGGTSASTPIIAAVYADAGTPAADSYPNSYPYASASGLNDVTTGFNGECEPAYLCTAGPGYDGPTGLGTPSGLSAFRGGPRGQVSGTITDTATGRPISGAEVAAGDVAVHSDAQGAYTLSLPAGTYDITVDAFGFARVTTTALTIDEGAALNRDYALHTVPSRKVSGRVTDGSGHGWPLYARISVDGTPGGPVWTDPATGAFSMKLPQNRDYTLHVAAFTSGYQEVTRDITVADAAKTVDIAVPADVWAATAPAYATKLTGPTEAFTAADAAPQGWSVADADGTTGGWAFDDPGARGNRTGGDGGFAIVDSDHYGSSASQDSSLITPAFDFSGASVPEVSFDTDLQFYGGQSADIDASTDGGQTWQSVRTLTAAASGPTRIEIPLTRFAGESSVRLRFRYRASFGFWWALDNIFVGDRSLVPTPSGLVNGFVTDANTGQGLASATVTDQGGPAAGTVTTATPDDPNIGDGFFTLQSVPGGHTVTAERAPYTARTRTVTAVADSAVSATWKLAAGQLSVAADPIDATVTLGKSTTRRLTVTNTGGAPASLTVAERTGTGQPASAGSGAPLKLVKGDFSPLAEPSAPRPDGANRPAAVGASGDAWKPVADLPVPIMDNAVDLYNGTIYSSFGYDGFDDTSDLYALDPTAGTWTKLSSAVHPRRAPAHGFIDGKLYAAGGWGSSTGGIDPSMDIYDPVRNTWTTGAKAPRAYAGSGSTVLDGKLYMIGGCAAETCGTTDASVYDPAGDSWTAIAPYPEPIAWQSCAAIGERIYCAGGESGGAVAVKHAYVYNPDTDKWSPLADMPVPLWGAAYAAANGQLLMSTGVRENSTLTNQGFAFDPGTGSWTALPNANTGTFRSGGAAGLYKVGGTTDAFELDPTTAVELLPGYDQTGVADVSWLAESTRTLTLAPGQKTVVTLTFDSADLETAQPGTYQGRLAFFTDTPYTLPDIAVSLRADPPRTWGEITGTVLGATRQGGTAPLAGATVQIDSWAESYTLTTRADGTFALWLDTRNNPLTVIVAKDGYQPAVATVRLTKGAAVTKDVTLKLT